MQRKFQMVKGEPYPMGATAYKDRVNFSAVMNTKEECGVILYDRISKKKIEKVPFPTEGRRGNVCYGTIENLEPEKYVYRFYMGKEEFTDLYAKDLCGSQKQYGLFYLDRYDWNGDKPVGIPFENSILYLLHVKGFTKHRSSQVADRGTFNGVAEKIPYLKSLGITTLEIMPSYEFEEKEVSEREAEQYIPDYMKERYMDTERMNGRNKTEKKINYWGYKKGYYFAPKRAYAATDNPVEELKNMIKRLHENGIEVIMQFYFPCGVKQGFIVEVLKYWIMEYHIDGIHVKGEQVPMTLLATDPLLGNTKILHHDMELSEIYGEMEQPAYRNLAYYRDDFMYDMRKFLKGDDNMLSVIVQYLKRNPDKAAVVNFITNYYGFTLYDLVSYDRKHNEANGEDNRDGTDYNFSWNCGMEGKSRRKGVNALRRKQMKNAMALVLLAQGTPLIRGGDEFGDTQKGNNNPYCQDNELTWLNWDMNEEKQELLAFTKELIAFRKGNALFRKDCEYKMMDYISCGYPDCSYHGEEAWKPQFENYNHHIGIMYCGKYAKKENRKDEDFVYVAYNLHWQKHSFALPKLPKGLNWTQALNTGGKDGLRESGKGQTAELDARSIGIYLGRKEKTS